MKILVKILLMVLGLLLLALVMGYLAGFFSKTIEPGSVAPPMPEARGEVFRVAAESERVEEQSPGTIRAKNETSISARITARILSITVRSGDSVEEGQMLVTLDDRDLQARLRQAEESLRAVEARLENAQAEFERVEEQFESGVVAKSALDQALANVRSLEAETTRARRAVDESQTTLSYAMIEAPISGRVVDRFAEPGDLVSPGVPILRLYDPESLRLEADVRESLATTLKRGDELRVFIDALESQYDVVVDEIVPQSDPASRSFIVKVALPDAENLYPGMFGRLLIPRGEVDRMYIPGSAVERVGQLEYVILIDGEDPVRRFIQSGRQGQDGRVEVLSGLSPGDVILAGAG